MSRNQNNVILVNPNDAVGKKGLPADFKVVQPDDLTIFVELTTQKKSRSSIVATNNRQGTSQNNSGTVGKVNFISGSQFGNNRSLTTSYTDIGSASLQSDNGDLEGFGIESIDITFDTAYTPLIKIKFVDVRGGMFQRGNESKYSVFFELPYPLFNLKVKGYYGRTVSYCLHLVKWNSLFNSNTGNFEIDAEFIGYTFAILTDLLIGFMRAAPFVDGIGNSAFNSVKKRYEDILILEGNLAGNQVITINDMITKISSFQSSLAQINRNSTAYKQLISVKNSTDVLNKIRKANGDFGVTLQSSSNSVVISSQNNANVGQSDIYYVVTEKKQDYDDYVNKIKELITELEEFVDGISDSDKDLIKSAIRTDKLLLSDFIDSTGGLIPKSNETLNNKITAEPKYDLTNDKDSNRVVNILTNIEGINSNPSNKSKVSGGFYIYDFIKFVRVMNDIISKNSKQQNELILKYQDELRGTLIKDFEFNPSIKNVFRILMASAETFLLSVQKVANNAKNNDQRTETLKQITNTNTDDGISDIKPNDKTIYPFPLYAKKETTNDRTQIEEAWLGSNEIIDTSVVDEILYTEALLSSLITSKQADIDREVDLNNSASWFSVNPLDTRINGQSLNPYYSLSFGGGTSGDDYIRLLMYRTFTYLGLTNPYTLDDKVMEYMAKFEANNLFYGFPKSDYNSANKTNKTSIYENYGDANSIISHWETGSSTIKNYLGNNDPKPYMVASSNDYVYRYIYSDRTAAAYIPISGDFDGSEFYETESILKNKIELRSVNFLGNYINSGTTTEAKVDDGAKYLDIIPFATYQTTPFDLPSDRAVDIIDDETKGYKKYFSDPKLIENTIKGSNNTTKFDPLSYKFYSNEFFTFTAEDKPLSQIGDNGLSDLSAAFIDNPNNNNGTRLSVLDASGDNQNIQLYDQLVKNRGTDSIIVPDISFTSKLRNPIIPNSTENFSLFGSPLYYAQNAIQDLNIRNYVKSYLFLNTLPLKGIYGKDGAFKEDSLINGIFSKNGGFIKTPSLWAAWVGSILWRYETNRDIGSDPILTKAYYNVSSNPISIVRPVNDIFGKRNYTMPTPEELFVSLIDGTQPESPMFIYLEVDSRNNQQLGRYKKVDKVILSLPEQAKETFINFFMNWSDNSFNRIKKEYELFNDNAVTLTVDVTGGVNMSPWLSYITQITQLNNFTLKFSPQFFESAAGSGLNVDALKNLDGFDSEAIEVNYPPAIYSGNTHFLPYIKINLPTESRNDYNPAQNSGNITMRNIFADVSVIINYTPRTFNLKDTPAIVKNGRRDITIPKSRLNTYLGFFTEEYKRLYDAEQNTEKETGVREAIFNSNNTNFIKLNIYRHLKAINDKWIYETEKESSLLSPCSDSSDSKDYSLISRFLFIDKNWEEIGDDFIINPIILSELIRNKYNQSLYDVISNVLSQNNFNFIPLPNYVEYTETNDMLANIFTPYPYVEMVKTSDNAVGPKFICMYVGQTSNHLDIKNSEYPDDSVNLNDGSPSLKDLKKVGKPIPAFEVNYGTQNQNFFKDLKLDQREFVETQESLEIIDRLSTSEDKNVVSFASQNLFNVYQTRSYSAEITALGMPLIQPMMYFQLNNVPMFRGAYVIINTSHSIKPNHMTTTFKGVRVKKENTPINKQVIAMQDLDIATSNSGEKYNINEIIYNGSISPNRSNSAGTPVIDIAATGDIYIDSFNKRTEDANINPRPYNFDRESNTKKNGTFMTYNEIFKEISEKTGFDVDILKIMAIMESNGGFKPGSSGVAINSSGYLGLMQFGRDATTEVADNINSYLKDKITITDYTFYASLSTDYKIIYPPNTPNESQWSKNNTLNNPTTNSMFDDYISALAAVYLAFKNIPGLEKTPSIGNPLEIYIAHQQGKFGLLEIKNNTNKNIIDNTGNIPTNMIGNLPPTTGDKSRYVTNQDWYTGWAGNVDAVGYKINPNYASRPPFVDSFNRAKGASLPSGALTSFS